MRIPLASEAIQNSAGDALNGAIVRVLLPNTSTPVTVYEEEVGTTPIPDGTNETVLGAAPGWVEEGAYDLEISGAGVDPPVIRRVHFLDASGTSLIQDDAITSAKVLNGSLTAADFAPGIIPTTSADLAYPDILQPGIINQGDFALTYNSLTQVTIAATTASGGIWARNNASLLTRRTKSGTTAISGITVATDTRLDQIVYDTNDGSVKRIAGTDTPGVSLTNRTGAAALIPGQIRLYDLVINTSGLVNDANHIRDRRTWARGAYYNFSTAGGGAPYAGANGAAADIDAALRVRVEQGGSGLRLKLSGYGQNIGGGYVVVSFSVNGAVPAVLAEGWRFGVTSYDQFSVSYDLLQGPGSYLISPQAWFIAGGVGWEIQDDSFQFAVEEILRPSVNNGLA